MLPAQRRAAIIDAVIPLLRTRGRSVSSKELAAAAGVAEGTIFAVFDDKETLLTAAVAKMLDTQPAADRLAEIDPGLPLDTRVALATDILLELLAEIWQVLVTLELRDVRRSPSPRRKAETFTTEHVAKIFEPSRHELRVEPVAAAKALVSLTLTGANPIAWAAPLTVTDIVTLLLNGIRKPA